MILALEHRIKKWYHIIEPAKFRESLPIVK